MVGRGVVRLSRNSHLSVDLFPRSWWLVNSFSGFHNDGQPEGLQRSGSSQRQTPQPAWAQHPQYEAPTPAESLP